MVEAVIVSNDTLDNEIKALKEICQDSMTVGDDKMIKIELSSTEFKSCALTYQFTTNEAGQIGYPSESKVHFRITSHTLPPKLVTLFTKKVQNHIDELHKEKKEHVLSSYQFLANVIENNNLLPAWFEFAEIKTVIDAAKGDKLTTLEKAGKLKILIKEG